MYIRFIGFYFRSSMHNTLHWYFTNPSISSTLWHLLWAVVMTCCDGDAGTLTDAACLWQLLLTRLMLSWCAPSPPALPGQCQTGARSNIADYQHMQFARIARPVNSNCNNALILNINQFHPSPGVPGHGSFDIFHLIIFASFPSSYNNGGA